MDQVGPIQTSTLAAMDKPPQKQMRIKQNVTLSGKDNIHHTQIEIGHMTSDQPIVFLYTGLHKR